MGIIKEYFQREGVKESTEQGIKTSLVGLSAFILFSTAVISISGDLEADGTASESLDVAINISKTEEFVYTETKKLMNSVGAINWSFDEDGGISNDGESWVVNVTADEVEFTISCDIIQDYRVTNELVGFCTIG